MYTCAGAFFAMILSPFLYCRRRIPGTHFDWLPVPIHFACRLCRRRHPIAFPFLHQAPALPMRSPTQPHNPVLHFVLPALIAVHYKRLAVSSDSQFLKSFMQCKRTTKQVATQRPQSNFQSRSKQVPHATTQAAVQVSPRRPFRTHSLHCRAAPRLTRS